MLETKMNIETGELCLVKMDNGVESAIMTKDGKVAIVDNAILKDPCDVCVMGRKALNNLEACELCRVGTALSHLE